ncbi:hypothetical protein [uncultured Aquitalea sp.]|uniref:hypothetical protein n=1 Tax=uncultured Aquitalea sp. TaxID=540272 RepID=UPI0025E25944|nr:hypothetical protein [uncultured Aquitalea sp.]
MKFERDDIQFFCAYVTYYALMPCGKPRADILARFQHIDRKFAELGVYCRLIQQNQAGWPSYEFYRGECLLSAIPYRLYREAMDDIAKRSWRWAQFV